MNLTSKEPVLTEQSIISIETRMKIKVGMIEDDPIIQKHVKKFIEISPDITLVDTFTSVEDFLIDPLNFKAEKFEILLLDIGLPGMSGLEGISLIAEKNPSLDIVMLTTYEEEDVVLQAMCAGAISYISKRSSLQEIIDAVRVVSYGGSYMSPMIARKIFTHFVKPKKVEKAFDLTERQEEILDKIIDGKSYSVIAKELFISVDTVRFHLKKLYKVLHVSNKSEAIAMYLKGNT